MSAQLIPVTSAPNQSFTVSLDVDDRVLTLQLAFRFNEMAGLFTGVDGYWVMSVSDAQANLLVDSVPLLTGAYPAANLLEQYAYLGIGSAFVINASGVSQDYPGSSNLGTSFVLLWDDTPLT